MSLDEANLAVLRARPLRLGRSLYYVRYAQLNATKPFLF
jgi:hypothetical protein